MNITKYKKSIIGFTLLELIIVVVILGILASLAIPMYTNAVEQRRGEVCINNMRTIFAAWRIYNMKYDPDYATTSGFRNVTTINSDPPTGLGTAVDERNFGDTATSQTGFDFWLQPTFLRLLTYKLQPPNQNTYIYCRYYPNGFNSGGVIIHYDWSGTWPWIPADE